MKKIWIILILPFFLTGCYDYQELNNRAVIAGIAIDYKEEEFFIDLEILNNKKGSGQEETKDKTYYIEGSGATLPEAFNEAHLKISKDPYYAHLKILVMSEKVAEEKLVDVLDYMIRDPSIRNIFLPVIAKEVEAKEILESVTTENPVVSTSIQSMIENNKTNNSVSITKDFENFFNAIIDPYHDAYLNTITKKEDTLKIDGIAAFHEDKLALLLDEKEASIFNTLKNNAESLLINIPCPKDQEKTITINFHNEGKTGFDFQENQIIIKNKLSGTIIQDSCKYDLRDPKVYQQLNEQFKPIVEQEFKKVLELLKYNQTDILGINEQYYKKNREPLEKWYEKEFVYNAEININKNGLIFEVNQND